MESLSASPRIRVQCYRNDNMSFMSKLHLKSSSPYVLCFDFLIRPCKAHADAAHDLDSTAIEYKHIKKALGTGTMLGVRMQSL